MAHDADADSPTGRKAGSPPACRSFTGSAKEGEVPQSTRCNYCPGDLACWTAVIHARIAEAVAQADREAEASQTFTGRAMIAKSKLRSRP
jgi:hypothetical protein